MPFSVRIVAQERKRAWPAALRFLPSCYTVHNVSRTCSHFVLGTKFFFRDGEGNFFWERAAAYDEIVLDMMGIFKTCRRPGERGEGGGSTCSSAMVEMREIRTCRTVRGPRANAGDWYVFTHAHSAAAIYIPGMR